MECFGFSFPTEGLNVIRLQFLLCSSSPPIEFPGLSVCPDILPGNFNRWRQALRWSRCPQSLVWMGRRCFGVQSGIPERPIWEHSLAMKTALFMDLGRGLFFHHNLPKCGGWEFGFWFRQDVVTYSFCPQSGQAASISSSETGNNIKLNSIRFQGRFNNVTWCRHMEVFINGSHFEISNI